MVGSNACAAKDCVCRKALAAPHKEGVGVCVTVSAAPWTTVLLLRGQQFCSKEVPCMLCVREEGLPAHPVPGHVCWEGGGALWSSCSTRFGEAGLDADHTGKQPGRLAPRLQGKVVKNARTGRKTPCDPP